MSTARLAPRLCDFFGSRLLLCENGSFPVAMMHYVARPPLRSKHRGLFLAPQALRRFVRELKRKGVKSVSLEEFISSSQLGGRSVALTFDDGASNLIEYALPVLSEERFQSVAFIVAGKIGGWNDWDIACGDAPVRLAGEGEIREWLSEGQKIGAHGLTHRCLLEIPLKEARKEIVESRLRLEDRFGVAVEDFCYPYGGVNEAIRDAVAEAGYRTACSTCPGASGKRDDPLLLKRMAVQHRRAWLAAIAPGILTPFC